MTDTKCLGFVCYPVAKKKFTVQYSILLNRPYISHSVDWQVQVHYSDIKHAAYITRVPHGVMHVTSLQAQLLLQHLPKEIYNLFLNIVE